MQYARRSIFILVRQFYFFRYIIDFLIYRSTVRRRVQWRIDQDFFRGEKVTFYAEFLVIGCSYYKTLEKVNV